MAKSNDHLDMAHKMVEDLNCEPHETFDDLIKCLHSIEAGKFNPYNIIELALGTIEITAPVIERTFHSTEKISWLCDHSSH